MPARPRAMTAQRVTLHPRRRSIPAAFRGLVHAVKAYERALKNGAKSAKPPRVIKDDRGTVTVVFMTVGTSTRKLALLGSGDTVPIFAGPLGRPSDIEKVGTVLLVGGCYGIGFKMGKVAYDPPVVPRPGPGWISA